MKHIIKFKDPLKCAKSIKILENLGATDIQILTPDTYCMDIDEGVVDLLETICKVEKDRDGRLCEGGGNEERERILKIKENWPKRKKEIQERCF